MIHWFEIYQWYSIQRMHCSRVDYVPQVTDRCTVNTITVLENIIPQYCSSCYWLVMLVSRTSIHTFYNLCCSRGSLDHVFNSKARSTWKVYVYSLRIILRECWDGLNRHVGVDGGSGWVLTYAQPRCRTLQYSRTFIPFSVSLWNDLASSVFDGVGLAGFKSRANASLLA